MLKARCHTNQAKHARTTREMSSLLFVDAAERGQAGTHAGLPISTTLWAWLQDTQPATPTMGGKHNRTSTQAGTHPSARWDRGMAHAKSSRRPHQTGAHAGATCGRWMSAVTGCCRTRHRGPHMAHACTCTRQLPCGPDCNTHNHPHPPRAASPSPTAKHTEKACPSTAAMPLWPEQATVAPGLSRRQWLQLRTITTPAIVHDAFGTQGSIRSCHAACHLCMQPAICCCITTQRFQCIASVEGPGKRVTAL
jgi:hypothetical protein